MDPLYLAANGANGSDLYEMGAHLGRIQRVCQDSASALMICHNWNKTGNGKGAKRMSGAGPDAWGRILISAAVISSTTDPITKASEVVLDLDFQGDEIAEQTVRIRRRVWVDDPDDLTSPMHYEVTQEEIPAKVTTAPSDGLRPSERRVLAVIETADKVLDVVRIGDALALDGDRIGPLKQRTIWAATNKLTKEHRIEKVDGGWRRAQRTDLEADNGS